MKIIKKINYIKILIGLFILYTIIKFAVKISFIQETIFIYKLFLIFLQYFNFFLDITKEIYPLIFTVYIFNILYKSSGQLNTNPEVSDKQKSLFTLKDVAGNKEEKEEMKELIDFLNNPHKYQ
ncbi:hypothetical protein AB6A63_02225, partial ['Camptotheca acuminata' phytoplasma]